MNDTTQKIASEAASRLCAAGYIKREHESDVAGRFQSAIEKATALVRKFWEDTYNTCYTTLLAERASRAAQASGGGKKQIGKCRLCGQSLYVSDQPAHASEPIRHDCPNCGYSLTDHTTQQPAHASEPFDYKGNAEVCDAIREMLKGFASIGGINPVDAYNLALAGAEVQREYSSAAHASEGIHSAEARSIVKESLATASEPRPASEVADAILRGGHEIAEKIRQSRKPIPATSQPRDAAMKEQK